MSRSEEDCSSSSEDEDVPVDEGKVQELEDKVCFLFILRFLACLTKSMKQLIDLI